MNRYSSHYYVRQDGTLGLFPVVEVDDNGVIVSLEEHGRSFTETAGVAFFGGIMVPGFIGVLPPDVQMTHRWCRLMALQGFLRFVGNGIVAEEFSSVFRQVSSIDIALCSTFDPSFSSQREFETRVGQLTIARARKLDLWPHWGSLSVGSSPGIMVMEGVVLKSFNVPSGVYFRTLVP